MSSPSSLLLEPAQGLGTLPACDREHLVQPFLLSEVKGLTERKLSQSQWLPPHDPNLVRTDLAYPPSQSLSSGDAHGLLIILPIRHTPIILLLPILSPPAPTWQVLTVPGSVWESAG